MGVGRWLLAAVLAVAVGGAAQAATVTQSGQDVTIHAGKVIVIVKKGRRARRHRHKHHPRVKKATLHTVTTVKPAAPVKAASPSAKLLRTR
ncbi:MAG TPA: hypothetical protein VH253_17735 [Phycisphaerae bacterium]|nr:hypothetical protein [Phycisphaerae bacterium]